MSITILTDASEQRRIHIELITAYPLPQFFFQTCYVFNFEFFLRFTLQNHQFYNFALLSQQVVQVAQPPNNSIQLCSPLI